LKREKKRDKKLRQYEEEKTQNEIHYKEERAVKKNCIK
jgi:hypothetical protein